MINIWISNDKHFVDKIISNKMFKMINDDLRGNDRP